VVKERVEGGSRGCSTGGSSDRVGLAGRNGISLLWWCYDMFMLGLPGRYGSTAGWEGCTLVRVVWAGGVSQIGAQRVACQSTISIRDVQMA
jgi:hypothetical protein